MDFLSDRGSSKIKLDLKNISRFSDFLLESELSDNANFIAKMILRAASGPGTDEELLFEAISLIKDERSLVQVNQALKKEGTYQHLQDVIDNELGLMDGLWIQQITNHLKKKNLLASTKKMSIPVKPVTKDQVIAAIRKRVAESESFVSKPYKDSVGIWTIGIGLNIQSRNDVPQRLKEAGVDPKNIELITQKRQGVITRPQAEKLLSFTLSEAYDAASSIFKSFNSQPLEIKGVLTDMVFNMGARKLRQFKKFIDSIDRRIYQKAAEEMKNSLWYKQVGDRAKELTEIVRTTV
jgi:lysozyme